MKSAILTAALFCAINAMAVSAADEWAAVEKEAKSHLVNLVNICTAQPTCGELDAARYIYKVLNKEKIDWDIFRREPRRANIVARLEGDGTGGLPILMVAHMDTVGADPSEWKTDPYKALEKDGRIYGRGTSDSKDFVAINLAIMQALKHSGKKLKRDVIMVATADEESGSVMGMRWLAQEHWKDINAGFAINEGGGILLGADGKPSMVIVEIAEKMYMDLKLTATGEGGHSAVPPADNALYRLSRALSNLARYKPQVRLTDTTRKFFSGIYKVQDKDARTTIDMLLSPDPQLSAQAAKAISADSYFNSQLRDTLAPTIIAGGYAANVVPEKASAVINCRLLPDTDPDTFLADVKNAIGDEKIEISVLEEPRIPFPKPMKMDDELFSAVETVSAASMPGAVVVGGMLAGTTDSEYLRRQGVITYGLGGPVSPSDYSEAHEPNESVSVREFNAKLRFIYDVVSLFASEPPRLKVAQEQKAR